MSLPSVLKIAANEIASIYPWLFTIDLITTAGTTYRFVHNDEDVIYNGNTYTKFPFQIELPEINSEGNIPSWNLKVDNTSLALELTLQEYQGLVDSTVVLRLINAGYLDQDYAELETELNILQTSSDEKWVTFKCGGMNLYREVFPLYRYLSTHCHRWKFKWHECYYNDPTASVVLGDDNNDYICYVDHLSATENRPLTGDNWIDVWRRKNRQQTGGTGAAWQSGQNYTAGTETCNGTLAACRAKGNSRRWGGFVGLSSQGVKLV